MTARLVGKYGAKRPQFPEGLKDIEKYVALPAPPTSVPVTTLSFPMDGNDQYGDCTMAAAAHADQVWDALTNENDPIPTEAQVISEYFDLTGGVDSGLVIHNVLKTWRKTGLWGTKICGYAPFSRHASTTMEQVVAYFGLAYVGLEIPQSAELQFGAGQPWTVVNTNTQIMGGHCIPIIAYDSTYLYGVTWGAVQPMSRQWFETYASEAWAMVPKQCQQAGIMNGVNFAALLSDLSGV